MVGNGRGIESAARILAKQHTAIPVFIKSQSSKWEYAGRFKVKDWLRGSEAIKQYSQRSGSQDITSILLLKPTAPGSSYRGVSRDELTFKEGKLLYAMHRRRERNATLAAAKKDRARRNNVYYCEVCSFDFLRAADGLGEACCEVHHRSPLAFGRERETRLADLALLCSNCHRMIHRTDPMMSPRDFQRRLKAGA